MNAPDSQYIATEALEKLRHRLLDLTGRNPLLSFRSTRQGSIQILETLPNELHQWLLSEDELKFSPIPSPSREELIEHGYLAVDPQTGQETRLKKAPTASEWARVLGYVSRNSIALGSEAMDDPSRSGSGYRSRSDDGSGTARSGKPFSKPAKSIREKGSTNAGQRATRTAHASSD
jgi:hypothetical protein